MFDIVYINTEPKTVDIPHRKEWVYKSDKGVMPWEKEISAIYEACKNNEITDDFWLFADGTPCKTLWRKIQQMEKDGKDTFQLRRTRESLKNSGFKTVSYEDAPMLINKQKAKELIERFPKMTVFRSTYGNVYE